MLRLRTVADLGDLRGKRVFLRLDCNVAVDGEHIIEPTKIDRVLPTIRALLATGARLIIASHFKDGRPRETLAPVSRYMSRTLRSRSLTFERSRVGSAALDRVLARISNGRAALLENLRRYPGEAENTLVFAHALARLADVYVNDAFAVCHRSHASVAVLPTLLPSAAGPLVLQEVEILSRLIERPRSPFIAVIGGAKISTKIGVLRRLSAHADEVLLGGALATTCLAARGYGVGSSLIDAEGLALASRLFRTTRRRNISLPIDVVVAGSEGSAPRIVEVGAKPHVVCESSEAILDIGPATILAYSQLVRTAATIVWNGPLGQFEREPFHHGSVMIGRAIASRSSGRAFGVVGGGETLAVLARTRMERYIDHVSTGGGAMLALLAGERMPGLDALRVRR